MSSPTGSSQSLRITAEEYKRRLKNEKNYNVIRETLEYIYGLNDEIVSRDILSQQQLEEVDELENKRIAQNEKLLEMICQLEDDDKYDELMNSLASTLQTHVKRFIHENGNVPRDIDDRPLTGDEIKRLRSMRRYLVDIVYDTLIEILDVLLQYGCLNRKHTELILDQVAFGKPRKLLEIIQSRSYEHFKVFLASLNITSPGSDNGAYVAVDSYIASESSKKDKKTLEEFIVEKFKKMSPKEIEDVMKEIKPKAGMESSNVAVAVIVRKSIRTYLFCDGLNPLTQVRSDVHTGRMKPFLQLLFNHILGDSGSVTVTYTFLVDISMQEFYLQYAQASEDITDPNCTHKLLRNGKDYMRNVFSQPIYQNVKERILVTAHMLRTKSERKVSSGPALDAFKHLLRVCKDWQSTFKQPTVKRAMLKLLKKPDRTAKAAFVKSITFEHAVACVTQLGAEVYVVTHGDPNVLLSLKPDAIDQTDAITISIGNNLRICSLVASEEESGIFCINEIDHHIWFWSKGDETRSSTCLKQFSPSIGLTISPTDHMRVLLLQLQDSNMLEIHDQPSKIVRTVSLSPHIERPLFLLRNSKGHLLLSHGSNSGARHRICMLSLNGRMLLTYGDKRGSEPGQLNHPCCMSLDDEDYLYVADRRNHRILLLDNKLNLVNVVLDKKHDGLDSPVSISYGKLDRHLAVAQDQKLLIYNVKRESLETS